MRTMSDKTAIKKIKEADYLYFGFSDDKFLALFGNVGLNNLHRQCIKFYRDLHAGKINVKARADKANSIINNRRELEEKIKKIEEKRIKLLFQYSELTCNGCIEYDDSLQRVVDKIEFGKRLARDLEAKNQKKEKKLKI